MSSDGGGRHRWLISYADMLTLLFCLFLTLFSMSQMQVKVLGEQVTELKQKLNSAAAPTPAPAPPSLDLASPTPVLPVPGARTVSPLKLPSRWQVRSEGDELHLSMSCDQVLFASGSAVLQPGGQAVLDELRPVLAAPDAVLRVEGHTDNVPLRGSIYRDNWELSVARSQAVVRYLMTSFQAGPQRFSLMGYGASQPVASNENEQGRRLNRRVVIVVRRTAGASWDPSELVSSEP